MSVWLKSCLAISLCFFVAACDEESKEKEHAAQKHVWQEQTDALAKAKGVESTVMDSAEKQRQMVDQQSGTE